MKLRSKKHQAKSTQVWHFELIEVKSNLFAKKDWEHFTTSKFFVEEDAESNPIRHRLYNFWPTRSWRSKLLMRFHSKQLGWPLSKLSILSWRAKSFKIDDDIRLEIRDFINKVLFNCWMLFIFFFCKSSNLSLLFSFASSKNCVEMADAMTRGTKWNCREKTKQS